ncbi:class I SAM-dependent methyltransferase [Spongorhabdus nitratireducens]
MPSGSTSSYAIAQGDLGASRLELLTQLTWQYSLRFLRKQISLEGKQCLEPGCGTGAISAHLLKLLGNEGRLTAFDIDPASIAQAKQNIPDPRAEFKIQNLSAITPDDSEKYDIIYCRFILEHIPDPVDVIHRLRSLLKAGGLLIAEDIDTRGFFCSPDNEYFQQFAELVGSAISVRGGNPRLGPRLPAIFQDAGFIDLDVEVVLKLIIYGCPFSFISFFSFLFLSFLKQH